MAPVTFHLISVSDEASFKDTIRSLPSSERPFYIGHCEHWMHSPKTSLDALTGPGTEMHKWDYLIIANSSSNNPLDLPTYLHSQTTSHWSIAAPVDDTSLSALPKSNTKRATTTPPRLPPGWSPTDPSGIHASQPPPDLEASLALSAIPLGAPKTTPPTGLKTFIPTFTTTHPGPVSMLNLVACNPGRRQDFFGYVAEFSNSIGSRWGGEPQFFGTGVTDWSSRVAEGSEVADPERGGSGVWEDVALVWYPSLWHFAKLLDDPDYAEADRRFKVGVLRDNPILCCTPVEL